MGTIEIPGTTRMEIRLVLDCDVAAPGADFSSRRFPWIASHPRCRAISIRAATVSPTAW